MAADPLELSQGTEATEATATPDIQAAVEQAPDEQVDGVVNGVSERLDSYDETATVMESLSENHQFNLDTITKQEVVRGEIVLHCNSLYEYLNMALPEPENKSIVVANRPLLERLSSENPDELVAAMADLEKSPDKDWIKEKLNYEGSAVNVQGHDDKIVIMRDLPIRRLFTRGADGQGRLRTESEKTKGEVDYQHTVQHEVQHVKFYNERGRSVQQILEKRKDEGNLSADEKEYIMVEFLTKDEVLAHMYNELTPEGNINWEGIKQNLRKEDYATLIASPENFPRYEKTVDELVDKAKEVFVQQGVPENPSTEGFNETVNKVTATLIAHHPQEFISFGKI